jgi:hypothetical protein
MVAPKLTVRKDCHTSQGRGQSMVRKWTYLHLIPLNGSTPINYLFRSIIRCKGRNSEILCYSLRRSVSNPFLDGSRLMVDPLLFWFTVMSSISVGWPWSQLGILVISVRLLPSHANSEADLQIPFLAPYSFARRYSLLFSPTLSSD